MWAEGSVTTNVMVISGKKGEREREEEEEEEGFLEGEEGEREVGEISLKGEEEDGFMSKVRE